MKQEVAYTSLQDIEKAVDELCSQLNSSPAHYNAVIFFASSSYNFEELSSLIKARFTGAEVIGSSTAGEISSKAGFSKKAIVLNALYDTRTRFKGILLDNIDMFPIVQCADIEKAASSIGISVNSNTCGRNAFAISLICGLLNSEEIILSQLYSIIKDPDFLIAGGSAGDDLQFAATYVSYNGKTSSHGAVLLFVQTQNKFEIYKENIFQKSGKSVRLTSVRPEEHLVLSIDNQNPRRRYAQILGISENNVDKAILDHPFGRVFGDNIFIASLVKFNRDGSLSMYARVLQDSMQEILEPLDAISISEQSCRNILQKIPQPGCIILFNCILRTIGFMSKNQQSAINDVWKRYFPTYSGFSTYGEQFGHINSNQTLVVLAMEE